MNTTLDNPAMPANENSLEELLGYRFRNKDFLTLALTHSSYAHEISGSSLTACNERLEFLGAAVLGLVITHYLYQQYPELSEGKLSAMKSRLVSGGVLGKVAKSLNLGKYLLLGKGEERLGGRLRKSMVARTLEAIVGAIFLDGGLEKSQSFLLKFLELELVGIQRGMEQYDYKSQLQKITQNLYGVVPVYAMVSQTGPDHGRVFRVRATVKELFFAVARGTSKKSAEQRAARLVLRKIQKEQPKDSGLREDGLEVNGDR